MCSCKALTRHKNPRARRNSLGAVDAEGEVAPGVVIASIITMSSDQSLGLKQGGEAFAVIKASNVMIGVGH